MEQPKTEMIQEGQQKFQIITNVQKWGDRIVNHTQKVGGDYPDCVNISQMQNPNNQPIKAKIPYLLMESECAVGVFLERGSGTELMIKAALKYAQKDVPSIPRFEFEDKSHIDCIEKNMSKPPPRKSLKPLNLAYFSIAYRGQTWYESRFNAKMLDAEKQKEYKQSLGFLTDPKQKVEFSNLIQIIQNINHVDELKKQYTNAQTQREFFENIPKNKRFELLQDWLNLFMEYQIGHTLNSQDWQIDVRNMDLKQNTQVGGESSFLCNHLEQKIFSLFPIHNFGSFQ